jgi:hypothetical protein
MCLSLCVVSGNARADGPYDSLLKHAPANSNVIALIDIKGAFASPLSKKENWLEKGQASNRGGLGFLPVESETAVIASDVNFKSMTRQFQVGLVKLRRNVPPMAEFAAREGGTFDEIAGRGAVLSPRDVYYIDLSASELAAVYPADRQDTARWLKATKGAKTSSLSPYLKAAADKTDGAAVTIAVDLEDVVDRTLLRMGLPASPTVAQNKNLDLGQLATFLAGVKGLTVQARIETTIQATMTWEFGFDPARFKKTLPPLILELIDGLGVSIPGLDTWEVSFSERSVTFSGPLQTRDLRNIVSLFAFPAIEDEHPDPNDPAPKKGTDKEPSPMATKRYMSTVNSILDDLKRTTSAPNYNKTATWHEKVAAQIVQLSRLRVDPLAVNAALQSAKTVQSIAGSLRGVPMEVADLESKQYMLAYQPTGISLGLWWGWRPQLNIGPAQVETNIPQIQAAISKVIDDDQARRTEAWSRITRAMNDVREELGKKYKMPF